VFQPAILVLVLALLGGTAARAQVAPTRDKQERTVNPADPQAEVRIAKGTATMILFPAQIRKKPITVDASRIRVLDVGARSIIVEAVEDLRADERQELEVLFADGKAPERATFVLVTHPSEVDTRIDVVRPEQTDTACQAEVRELRARCLAKGPEDFVLLGYVDGGGVRTATVDAHKDTARGFATDAGTSYRGKGWALVEVWIRHLHGPQPWTPSEAALTGKNGERLRARLVIEGKGETAPGKRVRVLVVLEDPPPTAGLVFTLEVLGEDGRSAVIPEVKLPAPAPEGQR
jgi:uncharacterized protein (TIGR02268 family)